MTTPELHTSRAIRHAGGERQGDAHAQTRMGDLALIGLQASLPPPPQEST